MEDRTEALDASTTKFLPVNLPSSLLSRRSIDGGERLDHHAHTHRDLPLLRRSATTTPGSSRSRSVRYEGDAEINLQPLTTTTTTTTASSSSSAHWPSAPSSGSPGGLLSSARKPSLLEQERKMRRVMSSTTDGRSRSSESRFTGDISVVGPDSPEDATDFKRSLEINMKDLVGDAVGNMSISPSSRDIVLAARKGLFIIDLENPLEVPRFLPQGGTWDVADVQWNPHPSRSQYIVSTSSEKMLIWNLNSTGKTSIEHILRSHYRAITDFNWHTTEWDLVASTGIDSWIFVWDLRTPQKPAYGLSAFKGSGTQVKWNRHDGNFLASAHANEVLIWDRRKGSLPMTRISAHGSKIYGIDWSHHLRNEIVTCSLDKTIKTWDTNDCETPKSCIETDYPVWRARNLPFGQGVLSLPQRGKTHLEMFARGETPKLVETFDGHTDVVKEFVWRKGANDEFQLITWSKDRTLRFWPVSADVMQKVGYTPEVVRGRSHLRLDREPTISHRNPPEIKHFIPVLSAPIGNRSILAEVRAGAPPRTPNLITHPHSGSSIRGTLAEAGSSTSDHHHHGQHLGLPGSQSGVVESSKPITMTGTPNTTRNRGGTMSRGAVTGKSVAAHIDAFAWLSNVKVGNKRGGSSGAGSTEPDSSSSSRLNSRQPSLSRGESESTRHRSASRSRGGEERREGENTQSLQDEITGVLNRLASSKIKPEKIDLTKKRTCTLGLHGPWGERSSVFMRVTFTFPPKYPQPGPEGTPLVELERSPLISIRDRAFILKRLRAIRERKRPCLEACLRFLLFAEEDQEVRPPAMMDSESSDEERDEKDPNRKMKKEFTMSILRNHKNLAEPRTSQGTFGPNGELICFFRAPPRFVHNVPRGLTVATSHKASPADEQVPPSATDPHGLQSQQQQRSRMFQSPAVVSDAIRQLSLAAKDRVVPPVDASRKGPLENDLNILRTMTNLLTVSQHKLRRDSLAGGSVTKGGGLTVVSTRRSNMVVHDTTRLEGPDVMVAKDYVFACKSVWEYCETNAGIARERGRFDHERIFRTVQSLLRAPQKTDPGEEGREEEVVDNSFLSDCLAIEVIMQIYEALVAEKDIQMLAMLSVLVLKTPHGSTKTGPGNLATPRIGPAHALANAQAQDYLPAGLPARLPPIKTSGFDYFSLARSINNMPSPMSPAWNSATAETPSPIIPHAPGAGGAAPSVASSTSSRGSWSSLFNTGSMRQFMNGVQDTLKDGLTTPSAEEGPAQVLARIAEKSAAAAAVGGAVGAVPPMRLARNASAGSGGSGGESGGGGRPGSVLGGAVSDAATFNLNLAGRRRRVRKESSDASVGTGAVVGGVMSKSWNDGVQQAAPRPPAVSFSSSGNRRGLVGTKTKDPGSVSSGPASLLGGAPPERQQLVVFEPPIIEEDLAPPALFRAGVVQQMRHHVLVYAEILFRWGLFTKRVELLNAVHVMPGITKDPDGGHEGHAHQHRIGLIRMCPRPDCRMLLEPKMHMCVHCGALAPLPACTVCRLPVKGLSRSCLRCYHVSHISCWDRLGVPICPTGCGCFCAGDESLAGYSRPPTRQGMSPPVSNLLLSSLTTVT